MGNLLPALLFLPPATIGISMMFLDREILGRGMPYVVAAPVLGWLALNLLGHYGNRAMRREMTFRLKAERSELPPKPVFVGFARPSYHGLLDAHEDVGHLLLHDDRIEFLGEDHRISLAREQVTAVVFRANVHTLLGLGRWVSVEGVVDGKPVRMLIEPRERDTMLGNLLFGRRLRREIETWLRGRPAKVG